MLYLAIGLFIWINNDLAGGVTDRPYCIVPVMRDLKMTILIALPVAPFLEIFEKYVFGDWEFVKFLIVLMIIDTALGFVKHWIAHDVSSKAWGMIGKKLIVYSSVMALSHVLASFVIAGSVVDSFVWFRYFACSALMVREGISIIENCEEITPGFMPVWIIKRLKGFNNQTGEKENEKH